MTKEAKIRITIEIGNSQKISAEFVIQSGFFLGNECREIRCNSDENLRLAVEIPCGYYPFPYHGIGWSSLQAQRDQSKRSGKISWIKKEEIESRWVLRAAGFFSHSERRKSFRSIFRSLQEYKLLGNYFLNYFHGNLKQVHSRYSHSQGLKLLEAAIKEYGPLFTLEQIKPLANTMNWKKKQLFEIIE